MVTTFDAKPGEVLRNNGWEDKFTCPNCHADHHERVPDKQAKYVNCECGARLRLELDYEPVAMCTIADPDEEEEEE